MCRSRDNRPAPIRPLVRIIGDEVFTSRAVSRNSPGRPPVGVRKHARQARLWTNSCHIVGPDAIAAALSGHVTVQLKSGRRRPARGELLGCCDQLSMILPIQCLVEVCSYLIRRVRRRPGMRRAFSIDPPEPGLGYLVVSEPRPQITAKTKATPPPRSSAASH